MTDVRWRAWPVAVIFAASLISPVQAGAAPRRVETTERPNATCGPSWSIVPAAHVTGGGFLRGIAAIDSDDVWTVGGRVDGATLTEHWNGTAWVVVASPNPNGGAQLASVAAVAPDDVWAAGHWVTAGGRVRSLIEHWNGSAWSIVPSPDPSVGTDRLESVTAVTSSDVWVAGFQRGRPGEGQYKTLAEHWDGSAWSVVHTPNVQGGFTLLLSVSASGPADIWAVGDAETGAVHSPVTQHWDGAAWTSVPTPGAPRVPSLESVTAISADDAWAVGGDETQRAIAYHWDGSAWSKFFRTPVAVYRYFRAVDAARPGDVWAVGERLLPSGLIGTLTYHSDGAGWTGVPSPNDPALAQSSLGSVSVLPSGEAWAAGSSSDRGYSVFHPLIERICPA